MSKEVLSFIIVPPFDQRAAVAAARERLENYLSLRFLGYDIKVGPFAPVGSDEGFCVLPIMNFVGDDGESYMCEQPSRWLLHDIACACNVFDLGGRAESYGMNKSPLSAGLSEIIGKSLLGDTRRVRTERDS
jgi:hypothetical protein